MFLYQNKDWPAFHVEMGTIRDIEERLIESRGFLAGLTSVVRDENEVRNAIADSLCSSWEIEGISLSERDICSSVARRLGLPFPDSGTRTYYDGIVDVLFDAVQNHEPLTAERILSWQSRIVEADPLVRKGVFRDDTVYVISGNMKKNTKIIYEAPPASDVLSMMDRFIAFVNGHSYPDHIMAAIAQYYFVAIHPFEDGNGRVARIISDYLLSRGSHDLPIVFLSNELRNKKKEYYALLDKTSRGSSLDVTEWVSWFLERLIDAYATAITKIHMSFKVRAFFTRAKDADLNDRQRKFLERVLRDDWQGALTAKKYAIINSCHPDTANRDLKKLVSAGLVVKEKGGSKNTHYSLIL